MLAFFTFSSEFELLSTKYQVGGRVYIHPKIYFAKSKLKNWNKENSGLILEPKSKSSCGDFHVTFIGTEKNSRQSVSGRLLSLC